MTWGRAAWVAAFAYVAFRVFGDDPARARSESEASVGADWFEFLILG